MFSLYEILAFYMVKNYDCYEQKIIYHINTFYEKFTIIIRQGIVSTQL